MVHDLLPMEALWPRVGSWSAFLGNLVPLRSEVLPPCLQLLQVENLGLIGIASTLVLTRNPLPPLEQWRLWRFEASEVVLCGLRPRLMQLWDHTRLVAPLLACVPDQRIEPIRPHELGVACDRPAHAQRRGPLPRLIEVGIFFAATPLADAPHSQPARAALDARAPHRPA
jgi:hypothetical protein